MKNLENKISMDDIVRLIADEYRRMLVQYFIKNAVFHNDAGRITDEELVKLCNIAEGSPDDFDIACLMLESLLKKHKNENTSEH
jgi:hypothetical protein